MILILSAPPASGRPQARRPRVVALKRAAVKRSPSSAPPSSGRPQARRPRVVALKRAALRAFLYMGDRAAVF